MNERRSKTGRVGSGIGGVEISDAQEPLSYKTGKLVCSVSVVSHHRSDREVIFVGLKLTIKTRGRGIHHKD